MATSYAGQGKRQLADAHIQKYLALVTRLYGKDHPIALAATATRARILFSDGKMAESEKLYRQILPRMHSEQQRGNIKAEVLADGLNNFAYLRRTQGDSHEAEHCSSARASRSVRRFQKMPATLSELREARSRRPSRIRKSPRKPCRSHRKQLSRVAKQDKRIRRVSDFH